MCDVRLFRSAKLDYETAAMIWKHPYHDEMILNNAAYHLQQAVEKILKGALECVGVTVPNTHGFSCGETEIGCCYGRNPNFF